MKFVDKDDTVVFCPGPKELTDYLNASDLWGKYVHPNNKDVDGWIFVAKDAMGKDIIMPRATIWERTAQRFESICKIEAAHTGRDITQVTAFEYASKVVKPDPEEEPNFWDGDW